MPSFRTEIKIPKSPFKIRHTDKIFSIGSCFSENIHQKLKTHLFDTFCNPCGIVYNPFSIALQMNHSIHGKKWDENDLISQDDLIHGIHHHGEFSGPNQTEVLSKMNQSIDTAASFLNTAQVIFITFGTSIIYTLHEKNIVVANSHKIPAHRFYRRMMDVQEIVDITFSWLDTITTNRPDTNFVFTLSPVRYLKEGFTDNTKSKARLALALESICNSKSNVHYFPAYEITLDDLRDYRFYKSDMIHPNEEAVEYIWSRFGESYFDYDTHEVLDKINSINKAKNHRPIHADTMTHRKFLAKLEMDIIDLKIKYPYLNI